MKIEPERFTNLADDDFDCFEETSSEKNTLHDALGITYQNIKADTTEEDDMPEEPGVSDEPITNNGNNLALTTAKRRPFEVLSAEVIEYDKRSKMTSELI